MNKKELTIGFNRACKSDNAACNLECQAIMQKALAQNFNFPKALCPKLKEELSYAL